ncbi:hypothetical protein FKM82_014071 [Ascaphus truei]
MRYSQDGHTGFWDFREACILTRPLHSAGPYLTVHHRLESSTSSHRTAIIAVPGWRSGGELSEKTHVITQPQCGLLRCSDLPFY